MDPVFPGPSILVCSALCEDEAMFRVISIAAPLFALALAAPAIAADPDWAAVAKALGKEGTVMQPDGVAIKPGLALGGWLAFEPTGDHAMMMGDLVLTQDEIAPVMRKLAQGGI